MDIIKAQWSTDGDNIRVNMPISKVDKERRLVSGWATLDNVDTQNDIVTAEANSSAFKRFRGNIREMHQPIAVGKLVDFKEDEFYDSDTKKFYRGIFATAYVSKGAQDTWEKVLDETLTGFSIGGSVNKARKVYNEDIKKTVQVVEDYDLVELSLVDSPANQLANFVSVFKVANGVFEGMAADIVTETVFWCEDDKVAVSKDEESLSCGQCGKSMENIGWFESGDDRNLKVAEIVEKFASKKDSGSITNNEVVINVSTEVSPEEIAAEVNKVLTGQDGGNTNMSDVNDVKNGDVVEEDGVKVEPVPFTNGEETQVVVEEDAAVVEPDLEKMFGDLKSVLEAGLAKAAEGNAEVIEKVSSELSAVGETFEKKFAELATNYEELTGKVESLTGTITAVEKRIDGVESDTAVKKSADLGGDAERDTLTKSASVWGGHFIGARQLEID